MMKIYTVTWEDCESYDGQEFLKSFKTFEAAKAFAEEQFEENCVDPDCDQQHAIWEDENGIWNLGEKNLFFYSIFVTELVED